MSPKLGRSILHVIIGAAVVLAAVAGYLLLGRHPSRQPGPEAATRVDSLAVYGANEGATRLEVVLRVPVPDSLGLAGRVAVLCRSLSEHVFAGLPVELVRLDSSNGRRVAVINLAERGTPAGRTWRSGFFQGSTGGGFTTASLVETFLQPGFGGEWLDGVRFLYEEEPVSPEWDHIRLDRNWYRTDKRSWP